MYLQLFNFLNSTSLSLFSALLIFLMPLGALWNIHIEDCCVFLIERSFYFYAISLFLAPYSEIHLFWPCYRCFCFFAAYTGYLFSAFACELRHCAKASFLSTAWFGDIFIQFTNPFPSNGILGLSTHMAIPGAC